MKQLVCYRIKAVTRGRPFSLRLINLLDSLMACDGRVPLFFASRRAHFCVLSSEVCFVRFRRRMCKPRVERDDAPGDILADLAQEALAVRDIAD